MKVFFIVLILLFICFNIYSVDHYIGVTTQGSFNSQLYDSGGYDALIGFNHSLMFSKYFTLENEVFLGATGYLESSYGGGYNYFGGLLMFSLYPIFHFGNNNVKFYFGPPMPIFKLSISEGNSYSYDKNSKDETYQELHIILSINTKIGINIYFGKDKFIIFSPLFIYTGGEIVIRTINNYTGLLIPLFQIGGGCSIKFKIGKVSTSDNIG